MKYNLNENFAFYGTLREGHGNYRRLVAPANGMKYEGKKILEGYKMFDVGYKSYPFVIRTGNPEDKITVELYHLPDKAYADSIHRMEIGAGYDVEKLEFDGKKYWMYYRESTGNGYKPVESGDWTEYCNN